MAALVSPFQSAFVPGRLISDNSLLAMEVGHFFHNKKSGREGFIALKLDLSKAYNCVKWGFLEAMFKPLGFADAWVQIFMTFVKSILFSFLINGERKVINAFKRIEARRSSIAIQFSSLY